MERNTVGFHIYKVPRVIKFIDMKNGGCQELGGEGDGVLLFNGCRADVLQDERISCTTM